MFSKGNAHKNPAQVQPGYDRSHRTQEVGHAQKAYPSSPYEAEPGYQMPLVGLKALSLVDADCQILTFM